MPKTPKPNITKVERQAPKSLKENRDITTLMADKSKSVVVMDREEYQSQYEKHLADKTTYKEMGMKTITKLLKGRIQRTFRAIKKAGHIESIMYNTIFPT